MLEYDKLLNEQDIVTIMKGCIFTRQCDNLQDLRRNGYDEKVINRK
jgi:hypothetical protein